MFMADCLASDLTSVFMVDKREAPDICSSTHKGGSTPKKKKKADNTVPKGGAKPVILHHGHEI